MRTILTLLLCLTVFVKINAQNGQQIPPPGYIKSIYFNKGAEALMPFFKLGERFNLYFDDLIGDESDYYYTIEHYDKNWKLSNINKNEYIRGMDDLRIEVFRNSMNTLQPFSHYRVSFPNQRTSILISGNYMINILNVDREVVFSRRFIVYEEQINIAMQAKRVRDLKDNDKKQRIELSYDYGSQNYINPRENFTVSIFQNGRWDNAISGIKPQFMLGTKFNYEYEETHFWGGNEYWFYDNSDIRQVNNMVAKIASDAGIFNIYLFPYEPREFYTFYEDVNGSFMPRNKVRENNALESDYAWVYFSLKHERIPNASVYVVGMFNNYFLTEENKLEFNTQTNQYETAALLKQGFTNYRFVGVQDGKINDALAIDGNFFETENNYRSVLYYRGNVDRYDRIIGYGETHSINITN